MDQNRFDDITRALAATTSRRQALKLLGGGLLAALVPESVLAKGGGNSAAAKFCAQVFGTDTPAAKQCTSEAAKHTGLYSSCSTNPSSICCPKNDSGYCTSYDSATCGCPAGQTCQNGVCGSDQSSCDHTGLTPCTSNADCQQYSLCYFDIDQTHRYCYAGVFGADCQTDCDCDPGYFCSTGGQSPDRGSTGYCVPSSS